MDRLLTVKEVMDLLNVSRATVYRLVAGRRLPSYKIGGLRFTHRDVEAFMNTSRTAALGEVHERQEIPKFVVG